MALTSPPEDALDGGISKAYPPAKRRKASIRRDFPMDCGRNAAVTSEEDHPWPPTAAAKVEGRRLTSSKVAYVERKPPLAQVGGEDAPMTRSPGTARTVKTGTVEGDQESVCLSNANSQSGTKFENAAQNLDDLSFLASMRSNHMSDSGVSDLYGPAKKRRAPAVRHFPAGCGRGAAAVRRVEPEAARNGDSEMEVGKVQATSATLESHAKKEPVEAEGEVSETKLQKAEANLGIQQRHVSTNSRKKRPLAVRHFPAGIGRDPAKASKSSHGEQARGGRGGLGGEGEGDNISESESNGSALRALVEPYLGARTPSLSRRAAEVEERGSDDPMAVELRPQRTVLALMAFRPTAPGIAESARRSR